MANAVVKTPTLFEIAAEFQQAAVALSDMEIDEAALNDTLESLAFPLEQKALNVIRFTHNLEAIVAGAREAEMRIAVRRKAYEGRIERLKKYVEACMRIAGVKKIEHPEMVMLLKRRKARVIIDNSASLPPEFWRFPEPPPPAPDKDSIYGALKAWQEKPEAERGECPVPGAHLEDFDSLEIR